MRMFCITFSPLLKNQCMSWAQKKLLISRPKDFSRRPNVHHIIVSFVELRTISSTAQNQFNNHVFILSVRLLDTQLPLVLSWCINVNAANIGATWRITTLLTRYWNWFLSFMLWDHFIVLCGERWTKVWFLSHTESKTPPSCCQNKLTFRKGNWQFPLGPLDPWRNLRGNVIINGFNENETGEWSNRQAHIW